MIASYAAHDRAARPVPPYTTRSSGRSATSGSRLFINIRIGASVCQDRAVSCVPRGARTSRAPGSVIWVSFPLVSHAIATRRHSRPLSPGCVWDSRLRRGMESHR